MTAGNCRAERRTRAAKIAIVLGRDLITRMNHSHGHDAISNDDVLPVLSTYMVKPIDWLKR